MHTGTHLGHGLTHSYQKSAMPRLDLACTHRERVGGAEHGGDLR